MAAAVSPEQYARHDRGHRWLHRDDIDDEEDPADLFDYDLLEEDPFLDDDDDHAAMPGTGFEETAD